MYARIQCTERAWVVPSTVAISPPLFGYQGWLAFSLPLTILSVSADSRAERPLRTNASGGVISMTSQEPRVRGEWPHAARRWIRQSRGCWAGLGGGGSPGG